MENNSNPFLDRAEIKKNTTRYQQDIVEAARKIDTSKINFTDDGGFKPRSEIKQKQKTYFWIRLYLREEDDILTPNDSVFIKYTPTGETLETKFICYAKTGSEKDNPDSITNYNPEDNKKIICLMVDESRINKNSEDIKFIRTLFKIGNYYDYQLIKREDLCFMNLDGQIFEYFDVDF